MTPPRAQRKVKPVRLWMVFGPEGQPRTYTIAPERSAAKRIFVAGILSREGELRFWGARHKEGFRLRGGTWTPDPDKPRAKK